MKKNEKNKKQWTKTAIVIVHAKECSAARATHYNIALLTKVYTDV